MHNIINSAESLRLQKNIDRPAEEIDGGSDDSTFFYEVCGRKKAVTHSRSSVDISCIWTAVV